MSSAAEISTPESLADPVASRARGFRLRAMPIAAAVLALGAALHLAAGEPTPDAKSASAVTRSPDPARSADKPAKRKAAPVGELLTGLEARLRQNPADAGGWLLLAKSYHHLGRAEEAKVAYGKAVALGKEDRALESLLGTTAVVPGIESWANPWPEADRHE